MLLHARHCRVGCGVGSRVKEIVGDFVDVIEQVAGGVTSVDLVDATSRRVRKGKCGNMKRGNRSSSFVRDIGRL